MVEPTHLKKYARPSNQIIFPGLGVKKNCWNPFLVLIWKRRFPPLLLRPSISLCHNVQGGESFRFAERKDPNLNTSNTCPTCQYAEFWRQTVFLGVFVTWNFYHSTSTITCVDFSCYEHWNQDTRRNLQKTAIPKRERILLQLVAFGMLSGMWNCFTAETGIK